MGPCISTDSARVSNEAAGSNEAMDHSGGVTHCLSESQLGVYADVLLEGGLERSQEGLSLNMGHGTGYSESELLQLKGVFSSVDHDGVGVIHSQEFVDYSLIRGNVMLSADELNELLVSLDVDGLRTLNFDEFVRACKAAQLCEELKRGGAEALHRYEAFIASNAKIISLRRKVRSPSRVASMTMTSTSAAVQEERCPTSEPHDLDDGSNEEAPRKPSDCDGEDGNGLTQSSLQADEGPRP